MRASSVLRQFAVPKFIALALTAAVLMMAGCAVEVVSPDNTYTLTTTAFPAGGGTVSHNPNAASYDAGTRVTVTAEPAEGYEFDYWTVTGGTIADVGDEITQVTVNADITMTAHFREVVITGPDTRWYTSDTTASTYTLFTADELAGLAQLVNAGNSFTGRTIVLGDDVDLSWYGQENPGFNGGRGWIPIGRWGLFTREQLPFRGDFDGGGNIISGLYINSTDTYIGLFGNAGGGTIKNLGLVDVEVIGSTYTGGLGGAIGGAVENCYVTGTVRGGNDVGGLVGSSGGTTAVVRNSYSEARVSGGDQVGGLVGNLNSGGTVTNSYATGAVSGNGTNIGGLVGAVGLATVANSYAIGAVSGNTNVGGLVGNGSLATSAVVNSAALNPDIESVVSGAGRIASRLHNSATANGNAAFAGMTRDQSAHEWENNVRLNGDNITAEEISDDDGTLGNRFRASNGWTVEPGKLPGLRGEAIDLPAHLR